MNLMCKVFRFRDRLPVHRLFVKIFSWFWVTALVMARKETLRCIHH